MLEQYRNELPVEDKDLLPDTENGGRRRLLFILAGAAFALVFFLFLMGVFRNNEDDTLVKAANEPVTKETLVAMEDKLQALSARIEKLEQGHEAPKTPVATQENAVNQPPLSSPEDAVAMTHQALRQMITKEVAQLTPQDQSSNEATVKKEGHKVAKAKAKKAKASTAAVTVSGKETLYVVQKGDTLSKISQRHYGTPNRWKVIYDANKERIANINNLKVGTSLIIPTQEAKQ
jgi:nucleoid-associated protein YgaU